MKSGAAVLPLLIILSFQFPVLGDEKASAPAEELDPYSQEALKKTQDLLKNRKARKKATEKGDARKADQYTHDLTGGNAKLDDEVYGLAADVLKLLTEEAHGDPKKMKELLDGYTRDPAGFAEHWTPEQREKLEKLSHKMPQPNPRN